MIEDLNNFSKTYDKNISTINSLGEKILEDTYNELNSLKMKMLKPDFWEKKNNLISLLLLPISFFIQLLIIIKKTYL